MFRRWQHVWEDDFRALLVKWVLKVWAGVTVLLQDSVVGFCWQADEYSDFIEVRISLRDEHLSTAKGSPCTRELSVHCAVSLTVTPLVLCAIPFYFIHQIIICQTVW